MAKPWRVRALRHLERLEPRIQALNGVHYVGCGLHYDMHDRAAKLRRKLTTPSAYTDPHLIRMEEIVCGIVLEELTRDVIDAEYSAAHPEYTPTYRDRRSR